MIESTDYDVIIVGGGPAGLSAATYAGRRELKTLVVSKDIGGQITKTSEIENYPALDHVSGSELAQLFYKQAKKFGADFVFEETKSIQKKPLGITTSTKSYTAKTIILAFGKKPRSLGVPGEEELAGKGVSYCATCDAPFFRNKTVAVVGGGNSALEAAIISSAVAKQVYLIHRRDSFRGEEILIDQVKATKNIEIILEDNVSQIIGGNKVTAIKLESGKDLDVDGVIVEIGFVIDRSLIEGLVDLDDKGQVVVDKLQSTNIPGVFAAGDITTTAYKQIVIAASEGATSALSAYDYIQKSIGKRGILADWH